MGEFELIREFFTRPTQATPVLSGGASAAGPRRAAGRVVLGVGDDCALLQPAPGMQMAISSDMLVAGRHFFPNVDPRTLGHKALAVNLSDLAACGARPLGFTLALALPQADPAWLAPFAQGLFALADAFGCTLVGGDTTRGPLNICITVFGEVLSVGDASQGQSLALLRSGAQVGDDVYVSGTLGDACFALLALQGRLPVGIELPTAVLAHARQRLEQPTPRIALGMALRGIATAAADISDGLLGDLGHILEQSGPGLGATLDTSIAINLLAARADITLAPGPFDQKIADQLALQSVLAGGDDYELVFTAPASARAHVQAASISSATPVTRIGRLEGQPGLRLVDGRGAPVHNGFASFDHFA